MSEFSLQSVLASLAEMPVRILEINTPGEKVPCCYLSEEAGPFLAEGYKLDGVLHVRRRVFAEDMASDQSWNRRLASRLYPTSAYPILAARFAVENGLHE